MSVIAIEFRPSLQVLKSAVARLFQSKPALADTDTDTDTGTDTDECENRARRYFILEMMEAHPEAFQHGQHGLDCQTMMELYHPRFRF